MPSASPSLISTKATSGAGPVSMQAESSPAPLKSFTSASGSRADIFPASSPANAGSSSQTAMVVMSESAPYLYGETPPLKLMVRDRALLVATSSKCHHSEDRVPKPAAVMYRAMSFALELFW
jgi:hypothetical protein